MFYFDEAYESDIRYDQGKLLEYDEGFRDLVNSYFVFEIKNLELEGKYVIVGEEERPDLLSYKIYKHTQYWWIILLYNDIIEIDEIKNGLVINYPSIDSLEELYFKLKPLQRAKSTE
jgi:hypothetical protein